MVQGFERRFLAISSVSLLGSCETKFMDAMLGRMKATKRMVNGTQMHKELAELVPPMAFDAVVSKTAAGEAFEVREVAIVDLSRRLSGRIDQITMLGRDSGTKNRCIVIDDKYTKLVFRQIPLSYKLQLTAYAAAVAATPELGSVCEVVGATLRCRESGTHAVNAMLEMGTDELSACVGHIGAASRAAWDLYQGKREPEHKRFDVYTGEWSKCYCGMYS